MNLLLIIILIIIIFMNSNKIDYFNSINYNNIFIEIKSIQPQFIKIKKYQLSNKQSRYIFNKLFNYSKYDDYNKYIRYDINNFLLTIPFIKVDMIDDVINIINNHLVNNYQSNTLIGKRTIINNYIKYVKSLMKKKLKKNIKNNLNIDIYISDLIYDTLIDLLIEPQEEEYTNKLIMESCILYLDSKNLLKNDNKYLNYYLESLNETLVNHLLNFNYKIDKIYNKKLYELKNLYYTGDIFEYNFKIDNK